MVERDMQTFFGKHIQAFPPKQTEVYELKIVKGTSIPFNAVQEHQLQALFKASEDSIYHKITDQPWLPNRPNSFTSKKPFDCFVIVKAKAFIVLWFYKPRQPKIFIKIPIKAWYQEMLKSSRKSLTEERALEIGEQFFINSKYE